MADEGSKFRDYRGTEGQIEDADPTPPPDERRRNTRGRIGVSRPVSPRPGVRYVPPESAREGSEGEKAYGPPTSPPPVQKEESEKRKRAKPDPLKTKPANPKDDNKEEPKQKVEPEMAQPSKRR